MKLENARTKVIFFTLLMMSFFYSGYIMADENMNIQAGQGNQDRIESYAQLSMDLIQAVRNGESYETISTRLAEVSPDMLLENLDTEGKTKSFWLNIYNAHIQILLNENPGLFEKRNSLLGYNFFSSSQITIAGEELSFDDIEHGIMRRSKKKISMGYLKKWFVNDFIKDFWWDEIDPRIHFGLNCGAASCPPIVQFDPDRVDEQLDRLTYQYLLRTTDYRPDENHVLVTRLISWFRADFGGVSGAIQMLKEYDIIPVDADPSVDFMEYDWTLELGNYQDL